jgi:hypothetical protein
LKLSLLGRLVQESRFGFYGGQVKFTNNSDRFGLNSLFAESRATLSHPRNATAPLIAVLVEALYYLNPVQFEKWSFAQKRNRVNKRRYEYSKC